MQMVINACLMELNWPHEYRVTLQNCVNERIGNGFEESKRAAEQILTVHRQSGLQTVLCLSGGVDSEHMLNSFLSVSKDFEVAIFRFEDGLNTHDINHAEKRALQHNLKLHYIDIDAIGFYQSGRHLYWAHAWRCQSPQLALHLECLSRIKFGAPILAWEPPTPWRITEKEDIFSVGLPGYKQSVYHFYLEKNFNLAVPYFFSSFPEQVCAFFKTNSYRSFCAGHFKPTSAYEMKIAIYREGGFPDIQPREKKTGFEKIKDFYHRKYNNFSEPVFDQLFREPMKKINPSPAKELQLVSKRVFSGV